jgi:hypothetical protein
MGGLLGGDKPKVPKVPALPEPLKDIAPEVTQARDRAQQLARAMFGRSGTILTGASGAPGSALLSKPVLGG